MKRWVCFLILGLAAALSAKGHTRLILFGGNGEGKGYPSPGVDNFVKWAGLSARVFVFHWASTIDSGAAVGGIEDVLKAHALTEVRTVPPIEKLLENPKALAIFQSELGHAQAVFFTGGDQVLLVERLKQADLLNALRTLYQRGALMSGISAGSSVASNPMIYQEEDPVTGESVGPVKSTEGIGFLPEVVVDQHFFKKHREKRLEDALKYLPGLPATGIGIDEDQYVTVIDNRYVHVPSGKMMWMRRGPKGRVEKQIVRGNAFLDLKR